MSEWTDIPALPDSDYQKLLHMARYNWVAERLRGKRVANAACGTNYGTPMLAAPGRTVVGFDLGEEQAAISAARGYGEFIQADIESQTFDGFDALVCVETLEHLREPWAFIGRLHSGVREMLLTTPIVPTKAHNKHHLHDFTTEQVLGALAARGWHAQEVWYQCDPWWKGGAEPMNVMVHAVRRLSFFVSICHAEHLPDRPPALARLQASLGDDAVVVGTHVERERAPGHVWSERQWRASLVPDASHALFLNDDLTVSPSFWHDLCGAISARPNEIVSLFANHPDPDAIDKTKSWFRSHEGLIGNGYVFPLYILREFLAWRSTALEIGLDQRSEDQLINLFAMWSGRDIYHTLPSLIRHDLSVRSTADLQPVHHYEGPAPATWDTFAPHVGRFFYGNHWSLIMALKPAFRRVARAYEIDRAPWGKRR